MCATMECGDCVDIVSFGVVDTTTLHGDGFVHNGEIVVPFLPSADLGCNLSGERARRNKGEPGSADLGRLNDDFFAEPGVKLAPGLYVCVVLEDPG